jgi:Tfp pilus assembly protein PilF
VARAEPVSELAPNGMAPAVEALAARAEQQRQTRDYAGAAATLERALRIEPQQAYLWNRLARVRLEQGQGTQASNLAARSNALAGNQAKLKQNNWDIIATIRRQSGDIPGAVEAERKAAGG